MLISTAHGAFLHACRDGVTSAPYAAASERSHTCCRQHGTRQASLLRGIMVHLLHEHCYSGKPSPARYRYDRIRETLVHELAHMVFGEHDNNFKELNSQLLRECSSLDWTRAGTLPRAGDFFEPEPMDVEEAAPPTRTLG